MASTKGGGACTRRMTLINLGPQESREAKKRRREWEGVEKRRKG